MIDRRSLLALPLVAAAAPPGATPLAWPPPETFPIWPGTPPGGGAPPTPSLSQVGGGPRRELQLRGVAVPMLGVYRPARPSGAALLVMPGGGYEFLAVSNEGASVAQAFAALGYTVFVLTYRLPAEGWRDRADVPLQDAQRAIRVIRARAATYGINPARVTAMGFSAGGHLAASLATAYDDQVASAGDAVDGLSARPDAAALIYAVTTLRLPETHSGSRRNLLGPNPSPAAVDHRSPVLRVDAHTPPSFLLHALDDQIVSPQCSLDWLGACRSRGVWVEAHIVEEGGHGFGVGLPDELPASCWPILWDRWIKRQLAEPRAT